MFNRIIVGVDGSPASITASRMALRIGNFLDIPVVGVYVIDDRLLEESFLADLAGVLGLTYYEGVSAKVLEFLEKQGNTVLTSRLIPRISSWWGEFPGNLSGLPFPEQQRSALPGWRDVRFS